jgi:amidophosphoribosyltransferase
MCGIVGLKLKNPALENQLGALTVPILDCLASRGEDSTGIAIYTHDIGKSAHKYSLYNPEMPFDWEQYVGSLEGVFGDGFTLTVQARQALVVSEADPVQILSAIRHGDPTVRLFGYGNAIDVFKEVGPASVVCERYGIANQAGYMAIGHTRMATESAVTTEHSHPFAVNADVCLVHNGSFSNYASVRRDLVDHGIHFDTDNDSEVCARFIGRELAEGATMADALKTVLKTFDGFYSLVVASKDSMAVVRDSFACKPMVVAETDDYVAVASEYHALAELPGIEDARVFEPNPEEVLSW